MSSLGCGDNSCVFGKRSGMATNGGCQCPVVGMEFRVGKDSVSFLDRQWLRSAVSALRATISAQAARIAELEAQ